MNKKNIKINRFIFLCLFYIFVGTVNVQSQVPAPKAERAYKDVSELIVKDSLFLHGIDSLIFNSFCPEIKKGKHKTFNIYSQERKDYFDLLFSIVVEFQDYEKLILSGYFEYKNYLFIWYGPIPEYLGTVSENKKKISYTEGEPVTKSARADFSFDYTYGKLIFTGICCF